MDMLLLVVSYLVYALFCARLAFHALVWLRAENQLKVHTRTSADSLRIIAITVINLIFFRKLFISSKMVWLGSWVFHISFFFVFLRHLRFFFEPVPGFVTLLQPVGKIAGYLLAASAAYLFVVRTAQGVRHYVSRSNLFIIALVFVISASGVLMNGFFSPDLVVIKEFILGILTAHPADAPKNIIFLVHFIAFLVLIPFLPFHVFTAPAITFESVRREENLFLVMHDKK